MNPHRYDGQTIAGLACLFSLQGIPCVYYGTEQGLSGSGSSDQHVREALWGKPDAFDQSHPFYLAVSEIARVRADNPALRYGRQYFRPVSGDGKNFGPSTFTPGVLAFSRILSERETVVVLNANADAGIEVSVLIDATLNRPDAVFATLFSSTASTQTTAVERIPDATVLGATPSHGTIHALRVRLAAGEVRILAQPNR